MQEESCPLSLINIIIAWSGAAISSTLSLFGSSFMIYAFVNFSSGKGIARLIFFLSIGDFCWALSAFCTNIDLLFDNHLTIGGCYTFRLFYQVFALSTVVWTACISHYIRIKLQEQADLLQKKEENREFDETSLLLKNKNQRKKLWIVFHILSWGSGIVTYIIIATIGLEQNDFLQYCYPPLMFHIIFWFVPLGIAYFSTLINYAIIVYRLKTNYYWKKLMNTNVSRARFLIRITAYLFIFLLCWPLDFFSQIFCNQILKIFYLAILQAQGFFDSIIYGVTNRQLRQILNKKSKILVISIILASPLLALKSLFKFFFINKLQTNEELKSKRNIQLHKSGLEH
eukprot:TRINITY_DN3163_c0_g1_i4.p1 TRINITY_DN3163_c0_g1~~TRINITY_DN3163_c0_g1_i4.p1  ORF type:complete len:342 (-),score=67.06 TRINITY_DN3163_c0_g1_i4:10-1035(-)